MGKPSKSANATEAPTSGKTDEALNSRLNGPVGLSIDELDFVNFVDQYYSVHGKLPILEDAVNLYAFTEDEYVGLITSELVRAALIERGITVRDSFIAHLKVSVDPADTVVNSDAVGTDATDSTDVTESAPTKEWKEKTLSPIQLIAVNTMLDLVDQRSEKKKLQDLGLNTSQWQRWLKDPLFSDYLKQRAEAMLGEHSYEANVVLLDKIRMGDMNAIKYYNEMTGRFVPQSQSNTGTTQISDFKQMLIRLLEIITEEIDDPATAIRISERIRGLIAMQGVANALMPNEPDDIVVPEIAKARVLTPKLHELMDKGVGIDD